MRILVPTSLAVGAAIEMFMCTVPVGGNTFYDTAKRLRAERIVAAETESTVDRGRGSRE